MDGPSTDAIASLLSKQRLGNRFFAPDPSEVEIERLPFSGCIKKQMGTHTVLCLPDYPPRRDVAPETCVHRFVSVLDNSHIRATLESIWRLRLKDTTASVSISNVGGYHSAEESIFSVSDGKFFSGTDESFLSVDVQRILADTLASFRREDKYGNMEPRRKEENITEASESPSLSGHLLLRTQKAPFKHSFYYLPIPPTSNSLVIFPGYQPHAVVGSSCNGRVSVAMNVNFQDDANFSVTAWCNINNENDYNVLHDHDEHDFAVVLYL